MNTGKSTFIPLLDHLAETQEPLVLRRRGTLAEWADESLHEAAHSEDPKLYALLAVHERVAPWQRARILFQMLRTSRLGLSEAACRAADRATAFLLAVLHPDMVLTVFLSLRRARANHKHAGRAILGYLLNHPALEDLSERRRPAVVDAVEHALGKNVARATVARLVAGQVGDPHVQRHLLRFARDAGRTAAVLPLLYGPGASGQRRPGRSEVDYSVVHSRYLEQLGEGRKPRTVTATNRGDIAATLVHIYRGGTSPDLVQALNRYVAEAAADLPRFDGRLALVLDASDSARGYGDREFCCLSQSVALRRVLEQRCGELSVFTVGGMGDPPIPQGSTDLAGALLDALAAAPDLVAIVSDGYENVCAGDLARVVATLPRAGIRTSVVFCHSKFTDRDDLALRRPAPDLPQVEFWHQEEFAAVILAFCAIAGRGATVALHEYLLRRLDRIERELDLWTGIQ